VSAPGAAGRSGTAAALRRHLGGLLAGWSRFELSWLGTFTLVNLWLFYAWDDSWVGLAASLAGMVNVVLVAKGKISNYAFGVVAVSLYAWIAWQNRYWGEVMLNALYFLPMQFVGLALWSRHRDPEGTADDVAVRWLAPRRRWLWGIASVAGTAGYALVLERLGGTLPAFDAASTVLSVIAMLLMVQRVGEQWVLWIVVDVVSIWMWAFVVSRGGSDISMVVMWTAYLVNAVYGLVHWLRLSRRARPQNGMSSSSGSPPPPPPPPPPLG
jgi:nicotinamide mononucleotide transporter